MLNKKAFTLVEMAIVLTIIGVLSASGLVGIKLVKNAKITATVAQVQNYKKAVDVFYKTYGALPGDLVDAGKRLPDCNPSSTSLGCNLLLSGGTEKFKECSSTWVNGHSTAQTECMSYLDDKCESAQPSSICSVAISNQPNCSGMDADCASIASTNNGLCSNKNADVQDDCDDIADGYLAVCKAEEVGVCKGSTQTACNTAVTSNDVSCSTAVVGGLVPKTAVKSLCSGWEEIYAADEICSDDPNADSPVYRDCTSYSDCLAGMGKPYETVAECQAHVIDFSPTYPYFTATSPCNNTTWLSTQCADPPFDQTACLSDAGYSESSCLSSNGYLSTPSACAAYLTGQGVAYPYADEASCRMGKYGYSSGAVCTAAQPYSSYDDCLSKNSSSIDIETCYSIYNANNEYFNTYSRTVLPDGQLQDGAIGRISWDMITFVGDIIGATDYWTLSNSVDGETILFWYELKQAGLIGGVTDAGINRNTKQILFGEAYPASDLGGGFWVAHSDGCCGTEKNPDEIVTQGTTVDTGRPWQAGPFTLNGNILVLTQYPKGSRIASSNVLKEVCGVDLDSNSYSCDMKDTSGFLLNSISSDNAMSPEDAKKIDLKMDDGLPTTGTVQPFGYTGTCYKSFNGSFVYDETVTSRHCGLFFKITE